MQQLLPTFEPSEADLFERAMSLPLSEKIENAVKTLQLFEDIAVDASPNGYWLAYSGGKDSGCIMELARMAGVRFRAVYNNTTIDPPELIRFIRREHPEVVFARQDRTLWTEIAKGSNGPPTRLARWCCRMFKEQGGKGKTKIIGVRVAESPRRKALWSITKKHRDGTLFVCPIVYWTDEDVWAFHALRNIPYCELYDQGFTRLGCVGCPLASDRVRDKAFERWPRYEAGWRRAFRRMWSNNDTRRDGQQYAWRQKFDAWEDHYEWWRRRAGGTEDECQMELLFS